MGELYADRVVLSEEEEAEEVVGQEEGEQVDVAMLSQPLLPLMDVEEDGVEVEDGEGAVQGGEGKDEEREEEEGGLGGVEQGGVKDDEVEVVADGDQLLQSDHQEAVGQDDIPVAQRGAGRGN